MVFLKTNNAQTKDPMTKLRTILIFIASFLCFAMVSCRKPDPLRRVEVGDAIALVAGEKISAERLRAELLRQHGKDGNNLTSSQKVAALDNLIVTDALYAKAKAARFDRTPEMESRIKNLIVTQYKEAAFPTPASTVTEQEIEQYYSANKNRYTTPAAIRGAVILIEMPATATPEKRLEFHAQAEAVLAEAKAAATPQEFADVVRRHSADQASRYRGGDIGWLTDSKTHYDAELFKALNAVQKAGMFTPLISTSRGLIIAKLLEKREPGFKPLSQVKETIQYQLTRMKVHQAELDFQASAKEGLDIQINRQLLESITFPVEKSEPPKMPGAQTAQLRQ
jgi:parvulin-like peptidyl-prolyl isomerase